MPIGAKYEIPVYMFYQLNPKLIQRYQPFLLATIRQNHSDVSETGWVNGLYVARAIGACLPKGKHYPHEPENLWGNTNDNMNEDVEPLTDADRFEAFMISFNAGFKLKKQPEIIMQTEDD